MHGLLHRALAPQTLASGWLVFTVALTLALAVAQSAIAAPASMGPSIRPLLAPALAAPCATVPAGDKGALRDLAPPETDARRCARVRPAAPSGPDPRFTLPGTSRSDVLAVLFGTAGPHGPPAARVIATSNAIPVFFGRSQAGFTLDFSLSHALRGPIGTAVAASSTLIAQAPSRPTAAAPVGAPL